MTLLLAKHGFNCYSFDFGDAPHCGEFLWRMAPLRAISPGAGIRLDPHLERENVERLMAHGSAREHARSLLSLDLSGCDLFVGRKEAGSALLFGLGGGLDNVRVHCLENIGAIMHDL